MEREIQLEAQMNSFTSELRANEARKDPYVMLKIEIHDIGETWKKDRENAKRNISCDS